MKKIEKIYQQYREIITYLFIGGSTTVVSIITYYIFTYPMKLDYMTSTILSWIISVIYAYITNKLIVFQSKTSGSKEITKEFSSFVSCRLFTLGIEMIVMYLLIQWLKIDKGLSKWIVQFIIFVLNYVFSKIFVFRKKQE